MASRFEDPKKLQSWFERVKADRANTEQTWQEIADNEFGMREFKTRRTPGLDRTATLYDTTALFANQLLASGLHGLLTNPAGIWFELSPEDLVLLQDPDAKLWLDDTRRRILSVLTAGPSGFTTNISEVFLDIPGFGMGALWIDPDPRTGVRFSARPLREVYIEEDDSGRVDVIFRECWMTARQFAIRFPNPIEMPRSIEKALSDGRGEERFTCIQLIAKSDDPFAGQSPFRKEWTAVTWMEDQQKTPKLIERKGYDEKPILTPRWSVDTDECYGRGPGWIALADAKMLNSMQKTLLKAAQKAADPPILATDESIISGIRTSPGGVNYVQDRPGVGGQPDALRYLESRARVDLPIELLDRKITGVRNAFWAGVLTMREDPRMTATQVLQLAAEAQRQMAPMLARMQQELLEPLVERVFSILLRQRRLATVPNSLRGQSIHVTYVSPIARAQMAGEANAIAQVWQGAALIAQASGDPSVLDMLNPDVSIEVIARAAQVPQKVLRDVQEVQALRAQRAQIQQEQLALQQANEGSQALERFTGALSEANQIQQAA